MPLMTHRLLEVAASVVGIDDIAELSGYIQLQYSQSANGVALTLYAMNQRVAALSGSNGWHRKSFQCMLQRRAVACIRKEQFIS